jgi:hypothetical protein
MSDLVWSSVRNRITFGLSSTLLNLTAGSAGAAAPGASVPGMPVEGRPRKRTTMEASASASLGCPITLSFP